MAKTRIILADTDRNYIIPLQLRFVEEFFDKVDLEIITDRSFFGQLFSTPQKAEILVVSEDLYDPALQRHNIGRVFLMTEQQEDERTDALNVTRIFKYTSIKEIFNEILGKSANILQVAGDSKKEPQIVMVWSAVGGAGKTTVALGIAACLTKNYKRVLYVGASWLQSFQRMLENRGVIADNSVYEELARGTDKVYSHTKPVLRTELFTYLPPFKASLMSLGLRYAAFVQYAQAAKRSGEYDYIIVDADTEFDPEKADLIGAADKVVIVTRQSASSVYATNLLASSINGVSSDKFVFICNDFDPEKPNALIAPKADLRFIPSEYVEHIPNYDELQASSLTRISGLQRVSFLLL